MMSHSTAHAHHRRLHASKRNVTLTAVGGYSCSFRKYNLKLDDRKEKDSIRHFFTHSMKVSFAEGEQMLTVFDV